MKTEPYANWFYWGTVNQVPRKEKQNKQNIQKPTIPVNSLADENSMTGELACLQI